MSKKLNVREIAIAITAKNLNPTVINPDFLKYSDIIPEDWKLVKNPVYTKNLLQLFFENGIGIIVQPNRFIFLEIVDTAENIQNIKVPELVRKCINKLPKLEYQAVGINPRAYVDFADSKETNKYLFENLLNSGSWQKFGNAPVKAGIQLSFTLDRGELNLGINEGNLPSGDDNLRPIVLFSGNFNYRIRGNSEQERLQDLHQLIQGWESNVETYQKLVNQRFLHQEAKDLEPVPLMIT